MGGCTYISGEGGKKYQSEDVFLRKNIVLNYVDNSDLNYNQKANHDFVGGLSVIDAIFYIGIERTGKIFKE